MISFKNHTNYLIFKVLFSESWFLIDRTSLGLTGHKYVNSFTSYVFNYIVTVGINIFESFKTLRLIGRDHPESLTLYIGQQLEPRELTYPQHFILILKVFFRIIVIR